MSCAVSHGAAPIGLATSTEVSGLTSEGSLVDLSILGPTEGHAVRLELKDSVGRLLGHVVDGVLVAEPVGTLDGVIEVPPPVVLVHVA